MSSVRLLPVRPRQPIMDLDGGAAPFVVGEELPAVFAAQPVPDIGPPTPSRVVQRPARPGRHFLSGVQLPGIPGIPGIKVAMRTVGTASQTALRAVGSRVASLDSPWMTIAVGALLLVGAAELMIIGRHFVAGRSTIGPSGSLTVTSKPAGARVFVDGESHGVTPATLTVKTGVHQVEIQSAGPTQIMALRVNEGGLVSRFFDLPIGTGAARLSVETQPAGARIIVDGRARGRSPFTIADLNPGPHLVRVERGPQSLERVVTLEPGATRPLSLPLESLPAKPPEGSAWLAVSVPVEMQVYENGRLVGTSRSGPWVLPAGSHNLEFVNESLGVLIRKTVDLTAGRTSSFDLPVPSGLVSVSASPSAEIQIDGEPIGTAPIVNRPLAAGQHDVVARHPQLGERRLSVTIAAGAPLSINLDLRR
jgi:hypothetical protein